MSPIVTRIRHLGLTGPIVKKDLKELIDNAIYRKVTL